MAKLKLSELIELESELHRRRLQEEIPSMFSLMSSELDLDKEYDMDDLKAYLLRRGYSNSEIDYGLKYLVLGNSPRNIDVYEIPEENHKK